MEVIYTDEFGLSTLRDYIHALGGRIEVNAVIGDERVPLVKE